MKKLLFGLLAPLTFAAFAQETHGVHLLITPVEGRPVTAGTVLNDPLLNPLNIVAKGQVGWEELALESKALGAVGE